MGLFRKQGGGKLFNKDGRIVSVELTTEPFGDKTSDKFGEQLYACFRVLPDGATDEPVFEPVKIGKAEDYTLDADRPLWLSTTNSDVLHPSSQMGKLIASMVEAGVSPETFVESDDAQEADFSALVNARFRFTYKLDEEVQEKFGKKKFTRKDGTKGETDRRYFAVSAVYELGEGNNAAPIVTRAKGKPNGKTETVTVEQVAEESLVGLLNDSPGKKMLKQKVAAKLALKLGKNYDPAKAKRIQALAQDDKFLAGLSQVNYDADTQQLSL